MTDRIRVDIYASDDPDAEPLWTLHEQSAEDWRPGKVADLTARLTAEPLHAPHGAAARHTESANES